MSKEQIDDGAQYHADWPWAAASIVFCIVGGLLVAMCAGWMPWQQ